jgi:ESCRT-II complex subunit VPS36
MEHFQIAELTLSGRPKLNEGEIELKFIENVLFQNNKKENIFPNCSLFLSNINLYAVVPSSQGTQHSGCALHLKHIDNVQDCASLFRHSRRIRILLNEGKIIEVKFTHYEDKDSTLELLLKALERKVWIEVTVFKKQEEPTFSVSQAGISGLMRRQDREMKSVDNIAKAALNDMNSLISSAREVVAVIERYAAIRNSQIAIPETASEISEENEISNLFLSIGILSPVTRLSAGKKYHQQLAKQIADMLLNDNRLERLGGMIALTDLYCIYNRARGTELVSPDDLVESVKLMESLRLGMMMRSFNSGVLVIQDSRLDDRTICDRILQYTNELNPISSQNILNSYVGVTPLMVSRKFKVSLIVAKEQLIMAEYEGMVCRDESLNGLFFFPNLFNSWVVK